MKLLRSSLAFALTVVLATSAPAHAETQYRYWSFWQESNMTWTLASVGAGSIPAQDGLVQGWRFLTAGVDVGADLAPRLAPSFDEICGANPKPTDGNVRIALVIDYGLESDLGSEPPAPRSTCVEIASGEPSTMALARAAEVREDAGFVCGLDQVPASGCGQEVEVSEPEVAAESLTTMNDESANPDPSDAMWDLIANIVTTLLGVVVFVMAWRRMMQQKAQKRRAQMGNESNDSTSTSEDGN